MELYRWIPKIIAGGSVARGSGSLNTDSRKGCVWMLQNQAIVVIHRKFELTQTCLR